MEASLEKAVTFYNFCSLILLFFSLTSWHFLHKVCWAKQVLLLPCCLNKFSSWLCFPKLNSYILCLSLGSCLLWPAKSHYVSNLWSSEGWEYTWSGIGLEQCVIKENACVVHYSAIWGPTLLPIFYVFYQCLDADDKMLCLCLFPCSIHPNFFQLIEKMLWIFGQQSAWWLPNQQYLLRDITFNTPNCHVPVTSCKTAAVSAYDD